MDEDQMPDMRLEIARTLGEPINPSLPVPVMFSKFSEIETAEPGERVYTFQDLDDDVDEIYTVDVNGDLTVVKRSPVDDTQLSFVGLNSKLEYVLVDTILNKTDFNVLGRKKARLSHGLDKLELRKILKAITDSSAVFSVSQATGEDLYDVIMKAKHVVEDFGDNFVLLAGTQVKEAIDTYDKDNVTTFNYNITLKQRLTDVGIEVVKVTGTVKTTGDSVAEVILASDKFILIAVNSWLTNRKPITFVRRKISADIARMMGADVDSAQRALIVNPTPTIVAGTNTLAFGVYAFEQVIWAITNPKAICKSGTLVL